MNIKKFAAIAKAIFVLGNNNNKCNDNLENQIG